MGHGLLKKVNFHFIFSEKLIFRGKCTLGTRGFSRVRREVSVLAEGRPETALEKSLAPRVGKMPLKCLNNAQCFCLTKMLEKMLA